MRVRKFWYQRIKRYFSGLRIVRKFRLWDLLPINKWVNHHISLYSHIHYMHRYGLFPKNA